jgi:hypothetical protein
MNEHDHLIAMLNRLKLTAVRDQLDSLIGWRSGPNGVVGVRVAAMMGQTSPTF